MDIKNLLTRSRNLLSHPPLWWKENEASRERFIGELDAAIHQPVSGEPAPDVLISAMFQHQQEDNEASMAFDFSDYRSGFRAAEQHHGIAAPAAPSCEPQQP